MLGRALNPQAWSANASRWNNPKCSNMMMPTMPTQPRSSQAWGGMAGTANQTKPAPTNVLAAAAIQRGIDFARSVEALAWENSLKDMPGQQNRYRDCVSFGAASPPTSA